MPQEQRKQGDEQVQLLWGGRFKKPLAEEALKFSSSFSVDKRLWKQDILGSIAHAIMLGKTGIVDASEAEVLVKGLVALMRDIESGKVVLEGLDEDIHSFVERKLREYVGEVAGKLHTARSRNDQVATDFRLWCRDAVKQLAEGILKVQQALVEQAKRHIDTLLPGMTHLQHAQPVRLAHHLLAHFWALQRDLERLKDLLPRINTSPLGAAALAGSGLPIDPELTARLLGFEKIAQNSMDAVSDRDFACELVFACALTMVHLSRLAEEIVLWSTPEFGFVTLDDAWCTGSSIMPQKRNPDIAELVRGKAALAVGALTQLLTLLKGLPLTYNRDLQEDKGIVFSVVDTTLACLSAMSQLVATATFNAERMRQALVRDFSTATDLADYLVRKGVPFRDAHRIVGQLVLRLSEMGKGLEDATLDDLRLFSDKFDEDAITVLQPEQSVERRKELAGTAKSSVMKQLRQAEVEIKRAIKWLQKFPKTSPDLEQMHL
ncbi:argininosuccinate lyase [Fervidibacter sacchari]|uniref:Argininosuccinate lyase n=1 Tax=Candidatus Fervidibacter sacchari TaxID=1448929 RepID=A0ABT2ERA4_9BACT|nr:argininosuccinate lyase [Candidatus Fervidibacter sacchari]MCS3920476.1 argininosuccinate lyase [Candidatus Fervidibacter sacchari]WKU14570.1 argininosuccinate lyase [Candidatus Fervidibacter sacchari]